MKRTRNCSSLLLTLLTLAARAQDLAPRAYVITPTDSNAITVSAAINTGQILFDPSVPVTGASATIETPILSAFHSFGLWGRSANILVAVPYAVGNFEGTVGGDFLQAYRSGIADSRVRFAINLHGGRAMAPREYVKWHERSLIGVSLTVAVPTGQYDSAKLVNIGANRWGIKPEIGFTRRRGHWAIDWYAGAWFFTENNSYYPGTNRRSQAPFFNGEAHVGYYLGLRAWASFDANFWNGGRTRVNGVEGNDSQRNSRIGGTISLPFGKHQTVKFSYSHGAYVTIGGDFNSINVGWQYSWLGKPW